MTAIEAIKEFGLPVGFLLIALFWFARKDKQHGQHIERLEQMHKSERDDWKKTIEKQFDDQSRNLNNNTSVLSELKTILQNRK